MNARIAVTLISANQYSSSPKSPTCAVLMAISAEAIADHPHPLRHARKPEAEVDRDRGDLGANREDLHERVGRADEKSGPRRKVALGEHAEGAGDRMHDRHLGERVAHDQRDERRRRDR